MQRRTFLAGSIGSLAALSTTSAGCRTRDQSRDQSREQATNGVDDARGSPMQVTVRRSRERGHADHGWLDTYHTFSFADYYDPQQMGYRSLRVINEDRVAAGTGFGTHPHRDMEIFTVVLSGAIEHKDSMGNGRVLRPGDIQLMSAGTGVTHSEFNPSKDEELHLLQIWIQPERRGLEPSYTEWRPTPQQKEGKDVVVISPDGRDGSAVIHQDAIVRRLRLAKGDRVVHTVREGRGAWLQVISGELDLGDEQLQAGDGASTKGSGELVVTATTASEALLFDLA